MEQKPTEFAKPLNIKASHHELLKRIIHKINQSINGKRNVMYSDIINLIIREDYRGKMYNEIILWCNCKIKQGKYKLVHDNIKL
jgi:hypothetical protein